MKVLLVRGMIFIMPLLFLSGTAFSFTQFISPSEEESVSSSIQIGSTDKGIQIRVRNAPLVDVFQRLTDETNIQFRVPDNLTAMRINADIVAPDWNAGVQTLLKDFSQVSLLDKHGKLSKVVILNSKEWTSQAEAMEQQVRIQNRPRPAAGTGKNPSIVPDIVLSKAQLRVLAKGRYGNPLPARLFQRTKYREFLAKHGIESIEDLNVIAKAKAVRRAARLQLQALLKSL